MLKRSRTLASAAVVALVTGLGAPAWAETLQDAIALAYRTNPNLLAQRLLLDAAAILLLHAKLALQPLPLPFLQHGLFVQPDRFRPLFGLGARHASQQPPIHR